MRRGEKRVAVAAVAEEQAEVAAVADVMRECQWTVKQWVVMKMVVVVVVFPFEMGLWRFFFVFDNLWRFLFERDFVFWMR